MLAVDDWSVASERNTFKHFFSGVGLLKGYELKLHVDESAKPVAQYVLRIPLELREKVRWTQSWTNFWSSTS